MILKCVLIKRVSSLQIFMNIICRNEIELFWNKKRLQIYKFSSAIALFFLYASHYENRLLLYLIMLHQQDDWSCNWNISMINDMISHNSDNRWCHILCRHFHTSYIQQHTFTSNTTEQKHFVSDRFIFHFHYFLT